MALPTFARPLVATACIAALAVFPTALPPSPAQARSLLEEFLPASHHHRQPYRKKRKATRKIAPKAVEQRPQKKAPAAPVVSAPIPTPRPEPENPPQKPQDEAKPPETAVPVPEEKPKAEPEQKPAPEAKPEPEVKPEPPKAEDVPKPAEPPAQKDERVYQVACPALISGGAQGKLLPPIEEGPQCGTHSPLSLTAIGKDEPLKFAHAITTDCAMAVTLAEWSDDVRKAAREVYGDNTRITEIGTGSDYQCRKVNGASTGRVSEHAFANALDIMSFKFSDGSATQLESGWNGSDKEKAFWRAVHAASCRLFMTVIGPDGDAAHRTNMHLDQGCHGASCVARICQ